MLLTICAVLFAMILIIVWIVIYDTHRFVVVRYPLSSRKIRKKTKIVLLSDLHNYKYGKNNEFLIQAIDKEKPDMLVLSGDMITANPKAKMTSTIELLKNLKEKYPIYYAYGNHEEKICLYKEKYKYMGDIFENELKEIGIRPYNNARAVLQDRGITIYGLAIEHEYYQRLNKTIMEQFYLEELIGKPDLDRYDILIAHNPDFFPEYAAWGADLVLSGHVHGGIVRVPFLGGLISPALRLFPKYDGGLFQIGDRSMILSRGIGTHRPNVRVLNPAELVVIELEPQD